MRLILLQTPPAEDEAAARRRCAVSLTFWAGLKPRELAALRTGGVFTRSDGTGWLQVEGRSAPAECPPELITAILAYRQARQFRQPPDEMGVLLPDCPLLTRLRSSDAISAHSAWRLVKAWPLDNEGQMSALGAKALRDGYVVLASADSTFALEQIALQTGHASASTASGNLPPSAIRIDRVRQRLTEAGLPTA